MENYTSYELVINPMSSFLTSMQSDIIFGHIIWAVSEMDGQEKVEKILREVKLKNPPFILSNAFPEGMLPKINNIKSSNVFEKVSMHHDIETKEEKIKLMKFMKKQKKKIFVPKKEFQFLRNNPITSSFITESKKVEENNQTKHSISQYSVKNTINRLDGSTMFVSESGEEFSGLYGITEIYYEGKLSIYIKIRNDYDIDELLKYLKYIELTGFGKKKSSGKGSFEIVSFDKAPWIDESITGANGFISLSNYVPDETDYTEIIYADISTKRGKLSGGYANEENIFKKPIVHYLPGAVFVSQNPREIKGKAVTNIHFMENILQFMIPFTVEVKL